MPNDIALPPTPTVDPAAFDRMNASHQANLATLNPDDPASPVYRRPDLAAQFRQRYEDDFNAIRDKFGVTAPAPKTAEELRAERFEQNWSFAGIPDAHADLIEGEIERITQLGKNGIEHLVAEARKDVGAEEHARLVAAAKMVVHPSEWTPAIAASLPVLRLFAGHAKYQAAYDRARAAAKLR
jgi:hypothetical protein